MNYPNFSYSVTTGGSYILEFWIKLDRINEFCKLPDFALKKYYFIADPHVIYSDNISLTKVTSANQNFNKNMGYPIYYQLLSNPLVKVQLQNFSQFNWNHILIHVNTVKRTLRVVTNFNYYYPDILIDPVNTVTDINLNKFAFCSNNVGCAASYNKEYLNNVYWGAAFYKDIRVSEGINWNFFNTQEYINKS